MFSGISPPSCSSYTLKKTAGDIVKKYGNEASTIVKRNFYLDDMLKSFPNVKVAGDMVNKVRVLCLEGGFNPRKFRSNNVDLIKFIASDLRKDGMKDKDLKLGNLTDNKALGVKQSGMLKMTLVDSLSKQITN